VLREQIQFLLDGMERRINELDRSDLYGHEDRFHAALHQLYEAMPRMMLQERGEEIRKALTDYPARLRQMLDARDQFMELINGQRSLMLWEKFEREREREGEAKMSDNELKRCPICGTEAPTLKGQGWIATDCAQCGIVAIRAEMLWHGEDIESEQARKICEEVK